MTIAQYETTPVTILMGEGDWQVPASTYALHDAPARNWSHVLQLRSTTPILSPQAFTRRVSVVVERYRIAYFSEL